MKKLVSFLLIAFLFVSAQAFAQADMVSVPDMVKSLKDKNTVIVSARSAKDYKISHVRNAVHINHKDLYKDGKPEGILKSPEEIAAYLGNLGISNNSNIIVYDDGKLKYAGRIYWVLKYMGAKNVKLLVRDMDAFKKARVPLTKAPSKPKKATFTPEVNTNIIADMAWIKSHLKDAGVVFVDVRAANEYDGSSTKPVSPGHIPGAVNVEWSMFTNGAKGLKTKAELETICKSDGISADKQIVLYCATSVRAGIVFFALTTELGYKNVRVYDGAMNEWSHDGSNPVEK